jgi:Na+/melibiose symporter-like transporter
LLFAAGGAQEATVTAGGVVTIIYYNQVLGLSPSLCGLAFMVAMIFDAVSDPLIGAISDNFKSRFGRRHPFMFFFGNTSGSRLLSSVSAPCWAF